MIKRIIFDVDYTLLKPNYDQEVTFLKKYVPEDNEYFLYHMHDILTQYELKFKRYEKSELLNHINQFSKTNLDEKFLEQWFQFSSNIHEQDVSDSIEILEYLKLKYEIVVLTNWFKKVQVEKLTKVDLLKYISEVYAGDQYLKPYPESYLMAVGKHNPMECMMIGDNLDVDVIGAIKTGLQAIHYTRGIDLEHPYQKVKTLEELKKYL